MATAPNEKPPEDELAAGRVGLKPPVELELGAGVAEGREKAPTFGGAATGAEMGAGAGAALGAGLSSTCMPSSCLL